MLDDYAKPVAFIVPKSYEWQPQEDITAYELSLCIVPLMAYFTGHIEVDLVEALPSCALRHFKVVSE